MIDLILWCNTKAGFVTFAKAHPVGNPLMDAAGNERPGVRWCWWGGDRGKMQSPTGEIPGFVMLMTIYRDDDVLVASGEQWVKSRVAKYIKDNGTPGTTSAANGSIPYYELSGVRIFRPADVEAWLLANDLPGHTWVGGNQY
jgi:hypothetical protein